MTDKYLLAAELQETQLVSLGTVPLQLSHEKWQIKLAQVLEPNSYIYYNIFIIFKNEDMDLNE